MVHVEIKNFVTFLRDLAPPGVLQGGATPVAFSFSFEKVSQLAPLDLLSRCGTTTIPRVCVLISASLGNLPEA